jgi:hypothetical protein
VDRTTRGEGPVGARVSAWLLAGVTVTLDRFVPFGSLCIISFLHGPFGAREGHDLLSPALSSRGGEGGRYASWVHGPNAQLLTVEALHEHPTD